MYSKTEQGVEFTGEVVVLIVPAASPMSSIGTVRVCLIGVIRLNRMEWYK